MRTLIALALLQEIYLIKGELLIEQAKNRMNEKEIKKLKKRNKSERKRNSNG